ncbi:Inositol monophosphatase 2 [Tetrabaena socialis]|uniref:inositol-phosphate phosphatase n=1 Tax=Tetrabaena socialis TaxID=47790 RepID=A0A2J7ZTJ4_9CHLO|nr:Inositol monophosphatase 2 [Tetrabaena socialis]|eukprot:PNH03560.1 Inositol monophosphatase 2 [Tetrabaena socialis]
MSAEAVPQSLSDHQYAEHIRVAVAAALAGGEVIREAFSQPKQVETKLNNHADLVTATDKAVEVGVVYNPVLRELFVAAEGGGAFLNGARLAVSGVTTMQSALLGTEVGSSRQEETMDVVLGRVRALAGRMRALRCTGSCALGLANVAAGRCDAFYEIAFGGCWDAAAGGLLVSEAGGTMRDPAGGPWDVMARRVMAAASGELADAMAAVLAGCKLGSAEPGPPGPGTVASVGAVVEEEKGAEGGGEAVVDAAGEEEGAGESA